MRVFQHDWRAPHGNPLALVEAIPARVTDVCSFEFLDSKSAGWLREVFSFINFARMWISVDCVRRVTGHEFNMVKIAVNIMLSNDSRNSD